MTSTSERHHTLSVEIGVPVPMRDGTLLTADVYRPAGGGRWPVVLLRTPYDRSLGASMGQQVNAVRLATAGYAVVVQDVRGRFASEGEFYPFRHEAADGEDTITWAAEQPWSTGAVGMVGSSYPGYSQILAAKQRHPALKAWFPGFTTLDARDGWVYEGDAFCLGFNLSWTLGTIAQRDRRTSNTQPLTLALDRWRDTIRRATDDQPELAATPAATFYFDWLEHRDNTAYWEALSGRRVGRCEAPAAQIGGWFDLFTTGTFDLHRELAQGAAGNSHRLIIGPWDHSALPPGTGSGETDFGVASAFDLVGAHRTWFDWLLREESEPDWSPARVFLTGWNRWEHLPAWPPPHVDETWFLRADGSLGPQPDAASHHDFTTDAGDPTPTVGGRLCCAPYHLRPGQLDQRARAARPDVLSYTTPVLDRDLLLAGPVRAEIWSSSSTSIADIHVTLVDVHPDGRALYLADGITRRHDTTQDPTLFDIRLGHIGHAVLAGHRLRVDVAGMSFPRFDRPVVAGRVQRTIALGATQPSRVILPIAG